MKHSCCNDTSFFHIFTFTNLMHDAMDFNLVYEDIVIEKDIVIDDKIVLYQGATFHQVNFDLKERVFHFINWQQAVPHNVTIHPKQEIRISQESLGPKLKW